MDWILIFNLVHIVLFLVYVFFVVVVVAPTVALSHIRFSFFRGCDNIDEEEENETSKENQYQFSYTY